MTEEFKKWVDQSAEEAEREGVEGRYDSVRFWVKAFEKEFRKRYQQKRFHEDMEDVLNNLSEEFEL